MGRRLFCYINGGLGDFYSLTTMVQDIARKNNIPRENIMAHCDGTHFYDDTFPQDKDPKQKQNRSKKRESAMKILCAIMNKENIHIIPKSKGTIATFLWKDFFEVRDGTKYENIKNDFMYYRKPETKEYIKSKLKGGDILIYGIKGEFNYGWKDGKNIPLRYKREALKFKITDQQKEKLDKYLSGKHLLIHPRHKHDNCNNEHFNKIINHCKERGVRCILIGLKDDYSHTSPENFTMAQENIIDLRDELTFEEIIYLIENAKYMLTSTSMFTYHRLFFNKPTIVCIPESHGLINVIFAKEQIDNPNHVFFDSDKPVTDRVIKKLNEFWGGRDG